MSLHVSIVERRPDVSAEQFSRHWRTEIAPIVASFPGVVSYVQNHVSERVDQQLGPGVSIEPAGVSMIEFVDAATMERVLASTAYQEYLRAFATIASRSVVPSVDRHQLNAPPPLDVGRESRIGRSGKPLKKRITILRRAPHLGVAEYRREWWDVHAAMVRALPEVEGYFGNHVQRVDVEIGDTTAANVPPLDNLVELWFADIGAMRRALPPEGHVQKHAKSIHSNLTIVIVNEIRIS